MSQTLRTTVQRGKEPGITLAPHRYADGCYVASPTRFKCDYIWVASLTELIALWKRGYKIRMSMPASNYHKSPSLIEPAAIELVAKS